MPPPAAEVCNDGIDNDRDGNTDCADDECAADDACEAIQPNIAPLPPYGVPPMPPPVAEICTDGVDNDGDGRVDCADDECIEALV